LGSSSGDAPEIFKVREVRKVFTVMTRSERAIRNTTLCRLKPVVVRIIFAMALASYIARIAVITPSAMRILLGTSGKGIYRSLRMAEESGMVKERRGLYALTPAAVEAIKEVFLLLKAVEQ
jgi:hypothetical protein